MINVYVHTPNKTLLTLRVNVTQPVRRGLEKLILDQIADPSIGGAVIKSMGSTWKSDNDTLLISQFLGLDSKMIALTKPIDEDPKKLGYNSEATNFRRTIRVVNWIPAAAATTAAAATSSKEQKQEAPNARRGSVDPSDPDFRPHPNRRRSRESVVYSGPVPAVDDHAEGTQLDLNDFQAPTSEHVPLKYLVGIDGSEVSHTAFKVARALMARRQGDKIEVLHICDRTKKYIPFDLQPDYIRRQYTMELLAVPKEQCTVTTLAKTDDSSTVNPTAKDLICKYTNDTTFPDGIDGVPTHDAPDVLVLGIVGRKGPKLNPKGNLLLDHCCCCCCCCFGGGGGGIGCMVLLLLLLLRLHRTVSTARTNTKVLCHLLSLVQNSFWFLCRLFHAKSSMQHLDCQNNHSGTWCVGHETQSVCRCRGRQ
jgi:hypothetical protein